MRDVHFFTVVAVMLLFGAIDSKIIEKRPGGKLPVLISYRENIPPDSIQTFIKTYLQIKGKNIINNADGLALMKQKVMSDMMDAINGEGTIKTKTEELTSKPLFNVFGIRIYNSAQDTVNYQIDSIRWFVGAIPNKDTNFLKRNFISQKKETPFIILKDFIDGVLSADLLR